MKLTIKKQIKNLFLELNKTIEHLNCQRREDGLFPFPKAKVQLLGQMSLLMNNKVAALLTLAHTADLDAYLVMENGVKEEFKKSLKKHGLIYDEDSYLIWIPTGAKFEMLFDLDHVRVEVIDPESALVSKAVKAPAKNKQLIREAIASDKFSTLVERILENGGKLEHFI